MKSTINDVAKEAGVSVATVSRVINANYPVKASTRDKVNEAINKLNFKPNYVAKSLVQKKTYAIGVLVPSITNIYFATVLNGIQDTLLENDYFTLLHDTRENPKYEAKILKILEEKNVDGIISVDANTTNLKSNLYNELSQTIPLVLVNGHHESINLNYVMNDQQDGTKQALNYLLSLGHKNIALIKGKNSYSYNIKETMYREIMQANNIPINENNIITIEKGNSNETVDLVQEAFTKTLESTNIPTAVYCCNDWMAIGALHAATSKNLNVPNDLSIIGNDNTVVSKIIRPKLTTVDQNMYRLGKIAANRLLNILLDVNAEPMKIVLNTKLIIRDSCKKLDI